MPAASTGPPAVGSPMIPLPAEPSAVATGVVVFSQPVRPAPASSAPAPASNPLRDSPEGSFKTPRSWPFVRRLSSPAEGLERAFREPLAPAILEHPLGGVVARGGDPPAARMRTRPAQVQTVDGGGVPREQRRRPHERHL